MTKRNGQVLVGAMVPVRQATAFRALAQAANLGVSAALRQMIAERVQAAEGREDLLPTDVAVGHSARITIRLRDSELAILTQAAKNAGTPIANLIRSIVLWPAKSSGTKPNQTSSWRSSAKCGRSFSSSTA